MKITLTFLITIIFSLSTWAEGPCQCGYNTSPGSQTQYVDPGTYSFNHSFGEGGTCIATCHQYPSGSCGWIDKSPGCYGAIADDRPIQACRFEKVDGVECVICDSAGVTCDWNNRDLKK